MHERHRYESRREGREISAAEAIAAVHRGDLDVLRRILEEQPELARAEIPRRNGTVTLLQAAADWPGYFPKGPAVVRLLLDAGAEPDAGYESETALHWAASSDDVDVAEALVDGGADIEAPNGSIGTPLENAVGYGCWHVARLLVSRGARVEKLWVAAALGPLALVEELVAREKPGPEEVTQAFWQACHGGQRRVAEYLLDLGADLNGSVPYSGQTPLEVAAALDTRRDTLVQWLRSRGARGSS